MVAILTYENLLSTYITRSHRINHLVNYAHFFPLESNPTLSGIVADLMGDGNLQKTPIWRIDFTSKDIPELERFESEMFKLFGIKGKIRPCSTNKYGKTYNMAFNCAPVARILYLTGVPAGQKVLQPFDIPSWIKEDRECFRRFCQRLFTCEGFVKGEFQKRAPRVVINMWKCEEHIKQGKFFFDEISRLMKLYFDIDSTVYIENRTNLRKDGITTRSLILYIKVHSVLDFCNNIGFEGEKQERLCKLLIVKKV